MNIALMSWSCSVNEEYVYHLLIPDAELPDKAELQAELRRMRRGRRFDWTGDDPFRTPRDPCKTPDDPCKAPSPTPRHSGDPATTLPSPSNSTSTHGAALSNDEHRPRTTGGGAVPGRPPTDQLQQSPGAGNLPNPGSGFLRPGDCCRYPTPRGSVPTSDRELVRGATSSNNVGNIQWGGAFYGEGCRAPAPSTRSVETPAPGRGLPSSPFDRDPFEVADVFLQNHAAAQPLMRQKTSVLVDMNHGDMSDNVYGSNVYGSNVYDSGTGTSRSTAYHSRVRPNRPLVQQPLAPKNLVSDIEQGINHKFLTLPPRGRLPISTVKLSPRGRGLVPPRASSGGTGSPSTRPSRTAGTGNNTTRGGGADGAGSRGRLGGPAPSNLASIAEGSDENASSSSAPSEEGSDENASSSPGPSEAGSDAGSLDHHSATEEEEFVQEKQPLVPKDEAHPWGRGQQGIMLFILSMSKKYLYFLRVLLVRIGRHTRTHAHETLTCTPKFSRQAAGQQTGAGATRQQTGAAR